MEIIIIGLLLIVIILLLILIVKRSSNSSQQDSLDVQTKLQNILMNYQNAIVNHLKNDLLNLSDRNAKQLYSISQDVNEKLHLNSVQANQLFDQFFKQLSEIGTNQQQLKELSLSIAHLQNVLTDKKTRGIFGEVELYHLLETLMGTDGIFYKKQYKLSNGTIADAILITKEPLRMICIDSKFPLENYNRIMDEEISVAERNKRQKEFELDVKKHIKAIHDKYIIANETADFAYLFLPAEAIFSYIHAKCNGVVEYGYQQKVYLVSPSTLMAYIEAMKTIYLGVERNKNVEQIQEELKKLHQEFERFERRYEDLCKDFTKIEQDFSQVSITAKKMLVRFKEIEAVELRGFKKEA